MVTFEAALEIILESISTVSTESEPVLHCLNRVCVEDYYSPWDIPPVDNSEMDGYAFSHASLTGNALPVTGFVPAGTVRTIPVPAGEAVKIMTGAPMPPGCDTVAPIEEVVADGDHIRLTGTAKAGNHVRKRGNDVRKGELVIPAGAVLRPQEIGMLSAMGITVATVFRKTKIAILSTGDELLEPGSAPEAGKIINSNSSSLAAQVQDAGAIPLILGIAPDSREATMEKILSGIQVDFLIITGGVSVGDCDYVKESIESLDGEMKFWQVNIKPGKPLAFATFQGKPIFALPGNPVAAMVTFEQFVRPAILKSMGHKRLFRPVVTAILRDPLVNKDTRPHLVRGLVTRDNGEYVVASTGKQGSNRLSSLTRGNCLIFVPPRESLPVEARVEVELLDREFHMREVKHGPPESR